jgi:hypothetical protein
VIDNSGAHRRGSRLGRVSHIGGRTLRPLRHPPTAADSPDTPALPQQLADHGTADRAGRTEYHAQEMVRLTIAAPPEVVAHMYCSNPIIFILRDLAADS